MMPERKRSRAFSSDLEHGVGQSRGDVRHRLLANALEPAVRLDERDVDLPRVVRHRRGWIVVEISFNCPPIPDCDFLIHRVTVPDRVLPSVLFAHGEGIDKPNPPIKSNTPAMRRQFPWGAPR